jgi:regulator of sigma E protease
MIGILFAGMTVQQFGAGEAFVKSFGAFGHSFDLVMKMLYYLVAGRVSVNEMAGPIGIAVLTEQSWKMGFAFYLNIVALISINLGIINLLPIPMLDGGNILLVAIETIRRKPLDEKIEIMLQKAGLIFVLAIVLLATYNDIIRAIRHFLGGEFLE